MATSVQPKTTTCLGSKTHYWVFHADQPRTLVMIHGFRGTHHGLQNIVDQLPDFKIIVPDLPGFGESTAMTSQQHDVAGYSKFMKAFMRKLDLEQPDLLGHSFGSIVAADIAATSPELIRRLVLVNPIAQATNQDARALLLRLVAFFYWLGGALPRRMGRVWLSNPAVVMAVSVMMAKTKDKVLRKKIHQAHLQHFSTFQDPKLLYQIYKASVKGSVLEYALRIPMPTLLIAGGVDNVAPLSGQKLLQKRLHTKLVAFKDVGHLIHHEAPIRAAKAIRAFLGKP